MKKVRLKSFVYVIVIVLMVAFIVSMFLFISNLNVAHRELRINPSMPILSRIMLNGNCVNYRNIMEFVLLEAIIFCSPAICYRLTYDVYKSALLCLMPLVLWGIMSSYSLKITVFNDEICIFMISALIHTLTSSYLYIRSLLRSVTYDEESDEWEDYDYE